MRGKPIGETKRLIREALTATPMTMRELADYVGIRREVCIKHVRELRDVPWSKDNPVERPFIYSHERTGGRLAPVYAWGDKADRHKLAPIDETIAKRAWYKRHSELIKRRKRGKVATPWDGLL